MSGRSPAHRLRTKTSDFSDFLRGGHSSRREEQLQDQPAVAESSKGKRSMIPFLGRSKKSQLPTPSTSTLTPRSSTRRSRQSDSAALPEREGAAELLEDGSGSPGKRHSHGPLPSHSNASATSLGSKFAAHFTPSKLRPPLPMGKSKSPKAPPVSLPDPSPSINDPRGPSHESSGSSKSGDRSPTPRPNQPTITVSISPPADDLKTYGDLFTLPPESMSSRTSTYYTSMARVSPALNQEDRPIPRQASTPPISPRTKSFGPFSDFTISRPSALPLGRKSSPLPPDQPLDLEPSRASSDSIHPLRDGSHTQSIVEEELEDILAAPLNVDSPADFDQVRKDDLIKSRRSSQASDISLSARRNSRIVSSLPYKTSERSALRSPSLRSLSTIPRAPTAPPSMPLPSPPRALKRSMPALSVLPSIPSLTAVPSYKSIHKSLQIQPSNRPRAHTISSGSIAPLANVSLLPASPRPHFSRSGGKDTKSPSDRPGKENTDGATVEQLRELLAGERARYELLTSHFVSIKERHEAEKEALLRRVDALERDVRKRDREIKGLRWLVMNGTGAINGGDRKSFTTSEAPSTSSVDVGDLTTNSSLSDPSETPSKATTPLTNTDHSGLKRSNTVPDFAASLSVPDASSMKASTFPKRKSTNSSRAGLGLHFNSPDTLFQSNLERGTPASSATSSAASSTSSLLLPSLNTTNTATPVLSAIPESPSPSPVPVTPEEIAAAERQREKEERRASRALRRISAESTKSAPSPPASVAYASNLNRGRSPSIAQLLDQTPMESALQKLRPFGESKVQQ